MSRSAQAAWWRPDFRLASGDRPEATAGAASEEPGRAVPFWGLMSFTFILLIAPQSYVPALAPFRIALLAAGAAITAHLVDCLLRRRPLVARTAETGLAAGLAGWALVTAPLSYWPGGSAAFLLDLYLKSLAIFWLLGATVTTLPRLRAFTWALSLMAVPIAATGVSHYLSGHFMPDTSVKRILGYDAPLTGNPNDLALTLNLILPLTVALLCLTRHAVARATLLAILLLEVTGVILTFSRAGFLALTVMLLMYVWRLFRRGRRALGALALAAPLLLLPFLPADYAGRLGTITDVESDPTGSAQERWNDSMAAVNFVLGHPLVGAGVGMNILALNEMRGATWRAVHNAYLETAVDLGLPGFVLFALLLAASVRSASVVRARADASPDLQPLSHLAEGIQTSLLAFAVAALFHPVAYHFYFYYLAGLAVAARAVCDAAARDTLGPDARPGRAA